MTNRTMDTRTSRQATSGRVWYGGDESYSQAVATRGAEGRREAAARLKAAATDGTLNLKSLKESVAAFRAASRFKSLGEQLQAIVKATQDWGNSDRRLIRAPSGANEGDPSAGGFLVQPNFIPELLLPVYEAAMIAPLCDIRNTGQRFGDVHIPAFDESSRADGSRYGGALAYWLAEADTITASLPRFKNLTFSGKKLAAIVRVTEELYADAPLFEGHVRRAIQAETSYKLDAAILAGNGAGQPLGILNSPATIVVSKETGQAAGTIIAENVRKMWSRLPAPSRQHAVWLVNEDAEGQLEQMVNVVGTSGALAPSAVMMYAPQGTGGNIYPLLKGRPVLTIEQASPLGTKGDIVLADLRHYTTLLSEAMPMMSADVRFLNGELVFRFTLRIDGQPDLTTPITPANGSNITRSPFVTLESR